MIDFFEDRWWIPFAVVGAIPAVVLILAIQFLTPVGDGVFGPMAIGGHVATFAGILMTLGFAFWLAMPIL